MNIEEFKELLTINSENEHLEFKKAERSFDFEKLVKYCVAISNEGGGKIILGVTDKMPRCVVGTEAFKSIEKVKSDIFQKINIRVDIEELICEEKRVLIIYIPTRPLTKPLHYKCSYYMRVGEELIPMTSERLQEIFNETSEEYFLKPAKSNVSAEEVIRLLDSQAYFELIQLPYPMNRDGVIDRFLSEKIIISFKNNFYITNLGAILFAKNIRDFDTIYRKGVRVTLFNGKSKISTIKDFSFEKGYAAGFKELIKLVENQVPSNEVIGNALRSQVGMYPSIAIRELVANAIIHQDFSQTGTSVSIDIYSDRIEFINPGVPVVPLDRFIDSYQSINERLADLMRRLRICEEKGTGIDKTISSVEAYQLPPPSFKKRERQTVITLYAHQELSSMNKSDKVRACYQHTCLKYIINEKMTNQSLRDRLSIEDKNYSTASRIIKETLTEGLIKIGNLENKSNRKEYIPAWG